MVVGLIGTQALHAQPDTRAADEQAIRETDIAWSKVGAAKDLERVLAFFTEDASELPPNAPIATGKEARRKVWSEYFATPGFAFSWQPTKVEVSRGGDLGYSMGTYELTTHDPTGKPVTDRGKYVTVWKKQADGTQRAQMACPMTAGRARERWAGRQSEGRYQSLRPTKRQTV
jgi:ketosteroid isomerase-like protein